VQRASAPKGGVRTAWIAPVEAFFHESTREPPSGRLPLVRADGTSWDGTEDGTSGFRTGRDWNRLEARGT
jgi:hypothetical protein